MVLGGIPSSETTPYDALAKQLAVSATAQQFAAAWVTNRLAVAAPCHQAVRADEAISGYCCGGAGTRGLSDMEGVA